MSKTYEKQPLTFKTKAYDKQNAAKQLAQQRKEDKRNADAIKKENARIAKIEKANKRIESENARTRGATAIANRRKAQHEQRASHPLVKIFHSTKSKTAPRRRRRTKVFGRGSGWNL